MDELPSLPPTLEPAQPPTLEPVQPVQPRQPLMSLPARMLNVFAVPGEVFDDVKASVPSIANYLVPALLYLLVGWIGAWLIYSQPAVQQQQQELADKMLDRMVQKGMMSKDQAEKQTQASAVGNKVGFSAGPVFGAFVIPLISAVIIWFAGAKVHKAQFKFKKGLEVAGLANGIAALGNLVHCLIVVVLGDMFASPSLGLLKVHEPQSLSYGLLSLVNPLSFWLLAVLALGLSRLASVPFIRAAVWIFIPWLLWNGLMIAVGQIVKMVFGL